MASNKFVSRGGDKLQSALEEFEINVKDSLILDVGSSTGGFVDCLLLNGAAKVYSVDTAYGELAWKLRNDPKVEVLERTNILHLEILPELVDLITIDAGWTRLELVLPVVKKFLKPEGKIIALLKPHYELAKNLPKGGVLKKELAEQVKGTAVETIQKLGFKIKKEMESPLLGGAGNLEFLLYITLGE